MEVELPEGKGAVVLMLGAKYLVNVALGLFGSRMRRICAERGKSNSREFRAMTLPKK
jgi:hypothetical protein